MFVPGVSELYRYGKSSDPGMIVHLLRVRRDLNVVPRGNSRRALALYTLANRRSADAGGFPHRAGRYRPGESPFSSPGCWFFRCMEGFVIRGWYSISSPGTHGSTSHILLAISRWCQGFHAMGSGVDPGSRRFHPRLVVGVVEIWRNSWLGDGTLSSPAAAEP